MLYTSLHRIKKLLHRIKYLGIKENALLLDQNISLNDVIKLNDGELEALLQRYESLMELDDIALYKALADLETL